MPDLAWDNAFTGSLRPGEKPALLLVDMVMAYLEPDSPLFMKTATAARDSAAELLEAARVAEIPVIHTNVKYREDGSDGGHFFRKVPGLSVWAGENRPLGAFAKSLLPRDGERIFTKQYPSAFFGTELAMHLESLEIDTVIIAGYSTSGCVRASTLDALQYGFIPIVATDACADRDEATQSANLHDLGSKYAELQTTPEILSWLL